MPDSSDDENVQFKSNMEILEPHNEKKGFFGDASSNKTFMKITGIVAVVAVVVLVIVLPVYFEVIEPNSSADVIITIAPPTAETERFDCLPESNVTEEMCQERGCTWLPTDSTSPDCFYSGPPMYGRSGFPSVGDTGLTDMLKLSTNAPDYYGQQFDFLLVETQYITESTVRIKISPRNFDRYEVPMDHADPTIPINPLYSVQHTSENSRFGVKITRRTTGKVVFDTSVGELMFADQFLQISTRVASEYIYGFGEHMHESFKHNMDWKTYGIFTRDVNVMPDMNLYGAHPYFMCMEGDGNAYGVFFVNSNAMDVTLQPTPAITYRSVGGLIDFYIFLGPSPEQVTQQYTEVIGRPYFPPYWSLGFQLCRWGYETITELMTVVERNKATGIPYDVQYTDIDYMERQLDFTVDNDTFYGLEEYIRTEIKDKNMRFIVILDPAISANETDSYPPFENGVRDNVFIKSPDGEIAFGKVWPDLPNVYVNESKDKDYQVEHYRAFTAFPDFFLPNTSDWWINLTVDFHKRLEFDGLWIDMNEPASFVHGSPSGCPSNIYDNPPYLPQPSRDQLYDDTICMRNLQYHPKTMSHTAHYNLHSLYGHSQIISTLHACRNSTGERCIVISRSTFPGGGKYVGHWLGDNKSTWEHLAASIIGIMEFNLFGFPYIGADVCGFFEDTNYELCLRWMQLGAFYPFYRNHNKKGLIDQDPGAFDEAFINATKGTMETRYRLLPYLYTLFYDAHVSGSTVVRPLMNQFPGDINTYTINTQFLWGPALLITPVLVDGKRNVSGYFPESRWFDYYSGEELLETGKDLLLDAPIDHINLHVLGGHVIPIQEPATTTYESRKNPLGLIVALDEANKANGKLFWDDGTSIDTIENGNYTMISFDCHESVLNVAVTHSAPSELSVSSLYFETISIYGVRDEDINNLVIIDGVTMEGNGGEGSGGDESFNYTYAANKLEITGIQLNLDQDHTIQWS